MNYKIGFFYHLPFSERHKNRLIVTFKDNHLMFKLINSHLIPRFLIKTSSYYSFNFPVIYKEDSNGVVIFMQPLSSIPTRYHTQLTRRGMELHVPCWFLDKMNNPCCQTKLTCGSARTDQISAISVLVDGDDIFDISDITETDYYGSKRISFSNNNLPRFFYKVVIIYYIIKEILDSIQDDTYSLSLDPGSFGYDYYIESINAAKKYVNSFNIDDVLSDLFIEVEEYFNHKIGGDDRYSVHRTATLSSPIANNDSYLKHLINLGENCIYDDRGYCPAESMRIKGLVTGVYQGKDLEHEKQKIISSYSKEEHLGYILSEAFSAIMHNQREFINWKNLLMRYRSILVNGFHFDCISNHKGEFEKNFYKLNNPYEKNPNAIIDEINDSILESTKCSISNDEFELINSKFPDKRSWDPFGI